MFLALLQDFIAYECIEGDRLISTSVTYKLECLTLLPWFPDHHLRNNNNNLTYQASVSVYVVVYLFNCIAMECNILN